MKKNLDRIIKNLKNSNKNLGITLIALVITIVILLIISTVAITLLVNNNLMGNAKYATDKYNNEVEKENFELGQFSNEIENVSSSTRDVIAMTVPTGCIISQMGTTAPDGYLACDGTVYDISAYPNLAAYINEQFGSYDYFKIGSETVPEGQFKVPNLQGEFLRGTGANGHSNQGSGPATGTHQDGTEHNRTWTSDSGGKSWFNWSRSNIGNWDSTKSANVGYASTGMNIGNYNSVYAYTSRPTNTAVLYCIKY